MYQKIKLLIIGGCFPVQDNIEPNKLYHQILKNEFLELNNIYLDIKIIRYESISSCLDMIKEAISIEVPDWILFHLRVEPILLLAKIYSKYRDKNRCLIRHIRISAFNLTYTNKGINHTERNIGNDIINTSKFNLRIQNVFRELNYIMGYFAGNWYAILMKYLNLTIKVIELCKNQNILLIMTGPVSRPYSYFENQLSIKLNKYICRRLLHHNQIYVELLGKKNDQDDFLFCNDLKRVNEIGHQRIANIILHTLDKVKLDFKNITIKNTIF